MDSSILDRAAESFGEWQSRLVFEKKFHKKTSHADRRKIIRAVRERQKELKKAVTNGPQGLGRYLRSQLALGADEEIEAPRLPRKLTPSEYQQPPLELEEELGRAWQVKIPPRVASMPHFWLLCHIRWIEACRLGDDGPKLSQAFLAGQRRGDIRERETRNFLRRTGGIFVRGNVSVFSDCPLARAWWRYRLAKEVSNVTEGAITQSSAHDVLHRNRQSWETMVMLSLRRITAINQPRARAAIVHYLGVHLNGRFKKSDVKGVATALARLGLRQSLNNTPLHELYRLSVPG